MRYISTRGQAPAVDFRTACLSGLAPDGGLYVPEFYPQIAKANRSEPYAGVAARVFRSFADGTVPDSVLRQICDTAYGRFTHQSAAPLTHWKPGHWLMELFHGPTLAFKDIAMQAMAGLYNYFLKESGERMTIVCATSGDTGGAAAAAFAGLSNVDLVILHPHGRIAPVQRLFMTTTGERNVTNFAIEGDFDDCQAIVKSLFADKTFASDVRLSGVNSINWARIAAQSVYYAYADAQLHPSRYVVPSGNMGDALAAYVAACCGLLSSPLNVHCAVNENDALHRLISTGRMTRTAARETPSPAMDISVPSNFERLLFEVTGRNSEAVRGTYASFAQSGDAELPGWRADLFRERAGFTTAPVSNAETIAEMQQVLAETGNLICPHTAVGTAAARRLPDLGQSTIVLATASPAKFPETVKAATGLDPVLPERAKVLLGRPEAFDILPADVAHVRARIAALSHQNV